MHNEQKNINSGVVTSLLAGLWSDHNDWHDGFSVGWECLPERLGMPGCDGRDSSFSGSEIAKWF